MRSATAYLVLCASFALGACFSHDSRQMQDLSEQARRFAAALKYTVVAVECVDLGVTGADCAVRIQEAPLPLKLTCLWDQSCRLK